MGSWQAETELAASQRSPYRSHFYKQFFVRVISNKGRRSSPPTIVSFSWFEPFSLFPGRVSVCVCVWAPAVAAPSFALLMILNRSGKL